MGLWLSGAAAAVEPPAATDLRQWSFHEWSTEAGLPQISVNDMVRGPQQRLWVATENGLASFDGAEFEVYKRDRIGAMQSNWITRLALGPSGELWIGTKRNLLRWSQGEFEAVRLPQPGAVNALAVDARGRIIVGAADLLVSDESGRFVTPPDCGGPVAHLLSVSEGVWVAGGEGQLQFFDGDRCQAAAIGPDLRINAMAALPDQGLKPWLGTSSGLYRVEDGVARELALPSESAEIQALAVDLRGTLWIANREQLWLRAADGRISASQWTAQRDFPWVISLYPDREAMWLGSQQLGLRFSWPNPIHAYDQRDGLGSNEVWTFAHHRGQLLVGSNAGVSRWTGGGFETLIDGSLLPRPMVYSLYSDRHEQLWVGTRGGLARVSADRPQPLIIDAIGQPQINDLVEQGDRLWVASSAGLHLVEGGEVTAVALDGAAPAARVLLLARDQQLWAGSQSGLYRQQGDAFALVGEAVLDRTFVTGLRQLADGRLIVGTYDQGMAVGRPGQWRWYGSADGLLSDSVFHLGISEDYLSVSHPDGFYRIRLTELGNDVLRPEALLRDTGDNPKRSRLRCCNGAGQNKGIISDDSYWLPSLGGAVRIPIASEAEQPPTVQLLSLPNGPLPAEAIALQTLPRDLDLRYGAVDFRAADQLRYRYRLRGYEQTWVDAGTRRQAIYTNLPKGDFVFEVQARRLHGTWGPISAVDVNAVPVLLETWYAQSVMALLALMLTSLVIRWRMGRLQRQKLALESVVTERTQALKQANLRLQDLNQELITASITDSLTGLRNRRQLREQIEPMLQRLAEQAHPEARAMGLVLLDIDHFKRINDAHGHAAGDAVLTEVAAVIRRLTVAEDLCLRWGGEEFLVVRPLITIGALAKLADGLRVAIGQIEVAPLSAGEVRASVGCFAFLPESRATFLHWQKALSLADYALYAAKSAGRDRTAEVELLQPALLAVDLALTAEQVREWIDQGAAELRWHPSPMPSAKENR